jgi:hypothetical protein
MRLVTRQPARPTIENAHAAIRTLLEAGEEIRLFGTAEQATAAAGGSRVAIASSDQALFLMPLDDAALALRLPYRWIETIILHGTTITIELPEDSYQLAAVDLRRRKWRKRIPSATLNAGLRGLDIGDDALRNLIRANAARIAVTVVELDD